MDPPFFVGRNKTNIKILEILNKFNWENTTNIIGWFGICLSSIVTLPAAKASTVVELPEGALISNKIKSKYS